MIDPATMDRVSRRLMNPSTGQTETILSQHKPPKPPRTPKSKPKTPTEIPLSTNPTSFDVHIYKKCLLSTLRQFLKDRQITHNHPMSPDYEDYAVLLHEDDRIRTKNTFDTLMATLNDNTDPIGMKRTEAYQNRHAERRMIFENGIHLGAITGEGRAEEKTQVFEMKLEKEYQEWLEELSDLELPKLRERAIKRNMKREEWDRKKAKSKMAEKVEDMRSDFKGLEKLPVGLVGVKRKEAGELDIAARKIVRENYPKDMEIKHPAWFAHEFQHWLAYVTAKDKQRVEDNAKLASIPNTSKKSMGDIQLDQGYEKNAKIEHDARTRWKKGDVRRVSDWHSEDEKLTGSKRVSTSSSINEKKELKVYDEEDNSQTLFVSPTSKELLKKKSKVLGEISPNLNRHSPLQQSTPSPKLKTKSPTTKPIHSSTTKPVPKKKLTLAEYKAKNSAKTTSLVDSILKSTKSIASSLEVTPTPTTKRKISLTAPLPDGKREKNPLGRELVYDDYFMDGVEE